jgi:hypothetical protein
VSIGVYNLVQSQIRESLVKVERLNRGLTIIQCHWLLSIVLISRSVLIDRAKIPGLSGLNVNGHVGLFEFHRCETYFSESKLLNQSQPEGSCGHWIGLWIFNVIWLLNKMMISRSVLSDSWWRMHKSVHGDQASGEKSKSLLLATEQCDGNYSGKDILSWSSYEAFRCMKSCVQGENEWPWRDTNGVRMYYELL